MTRTYTQADALARIAMNQELRSHHDPLLGRDRLLGPYHPGPAGELYEWLCTAPVAEIVADATRQVTVSSSHVVQRSCTTASRHGQEAVDAYLRARGAHIQRWSTGSNKWV